MRGVVVAKFGGSLLRASEGFLILADEVKKLLELGKRVVIVVSAMKGVTDSLIRVVEAEWGWEQRLKEILAMYLSAARGAIRNPAILSQALGELTRLFDELFKLVWAVKVIGEATPHAKASIIAFGERLSAALASAVLRDQGVDSKWLSGGEAGLVSGGNDYFDAVIDYGESAKNVPLVIGKLLEKNVVPVVMGFTARNREGRLVLLGRGGSDYTATLLARFLSAEEVRLYTDVDGIYSGDPRYIQGANHIPKLSYEEAMELALLGAKKMHPRTFEPVNNTGIRVVITKPGANKATIVADNQEPPIVKGVAALEDMAAVSVSGGGLVEKVGIAAHIASVAAKLGINIKAIMQPPTETRITLIVRRGDAEALSKALEAELSGLGVRVETTNVSVIGIVGYGVKEPEVSAAFLSEASRLSGVRGAIWSPGSPLLSILVEPSYTWPIARRLHEEVVQKWWIR
jgi:aspartate kinase